MLLKTLRPYQAELIDEVLREPGHVLVQAPTGSGKTLQIVALSHLLSQLYDRILIAAPQQQIEEGFTNESGILRYPHDARVFPLPEIRASRESSLKSRQYLRSFLAAPLGRAAACTHQALAFPGAVELLPSDCRRILLVVDEAHHAPAEGLGSFIDEFERRGGHLHFYSATPWRKDGQRVLRPEMRLVRRTLPEHMAEGFAPDRLFHQIRVLGKRGQATSAAEFRGEKVAAGYEAELVRRLVEQYFEDGRPKCIVRVPPVSGGSSGLVGKILEAFESRGARTLDATGVGGKKQAAFLSSLRDERGRSYADSRFDVIVGVQRVLEGTDWRHCSAVYCLGMPGSLATIGQLLGRALRQKYEDCPPEHREAARIVFFVPGSGSLQKLSLQHSRNALLTSVFLADFEVGVEWSMAQGIEAGVASSFGAGRRFATADRMRLALDEEAKAEANALLIQARHHLKSEGVDSPSIEAIVGAATALAAESGSNLDGRVLGRAAVLLAAGRGGDAGRKVREAARRAAEARSADWAKATAIREDAGFDALLDSIFARIQEEFRDETLEGSPLLHAVETQIHGLTGGRMSSFMERMRDAFPRLVTHAMIHSWLTKHFAACGGAKELPKSSAWVPGKEPHKKGAALTWGEVEKALLRGRHGLPGRECLAEIAQRDLGVTCDCRKALNPSKVHVSDGPVPTAIEHHILRTGRFPRLSDDAIPHTNLTWRMAHDAVLSFQDSMDLDLPPGGQDQAMASFYLESNMVELLEGWIQLTGRVPDAESGVIPNAGDLTWSEAEAIVKRQCRRRFKRAVTDLGRGTGAADASTRLADLESLLTFWIQVNVYKWCSRWVRSTGIPPASSSGVIPDSGGLTWSTVDKYLRDSHQAAFPNGLPRVDSLQMFKDVCPYAYSSLEDRIAHFQVVKRSREASAHGYVGPTS